MLTVSKPLNSSQAQAYHKLEFTAETASYYKQDGAVQGEWQGQLAQKFGLQGAVDAETFALLSEGKNPQTAEQMVKHRAAQEYVNGDGATTKAVEHRAGWDATFSAPKSVSLTALGGSDNRVKEAHRAAVTTALAELERYTQARIGGNNPAETTGTFIAAKFEHDTARPVRRLRRASAPHLRRSFQRDGAGGRDHTSRPTAELLRLPKLRDSRLSIRTHPSAPQAGLRDRRGQERRTGDRGLLAGVPLRFEPTFPTNTRAFREVWPERTRRRPNSRSRDPRHEADSHAAVACPVFCTK